MKLALAILIAVVGAIYSAISGDDPKVTACMRPVDKVEVAFRKSPPQTDPRNSVEAGLQRARTWCRENKPTDAAAAAEVAALLCIARGGCKPLVEEARRQRQSSR